MMNQRLKELREQAADFAEKAYDKQTMATFDTNKSAQELFEQKFAELIVRECMDCATWVGKTNTSPVEPIHTAHAINQRMRQQFGVE